MGFSAQAKAIITAPATASRPSVAARGQPGSASGRQAIAAPQRKTAHPIMIGNVSGPTGSWRKLPRMTNAPTTKAADRIITARPKTRSVAAMPLVHADLAAQGHGLGLGLGDVLIDPGLELVAHLGERREAVGLHRRLPLVAAGDLLQLVGPALERLVRDVLGHVDPAPVYRDRSLPRPSPRRARWRWECPPSPAPAPRSGPRARARRRCARTRRPRACRPSSPA